MTSNDNTVRSTRIASNLWMASNNNTVRIVSNVNIVSNSSMASNDNIVRRVSTYCK